MVPRHDQHVARVELPEVEERDRVAVSGYEGRRLPPRDEVTERAGRHPYCRLISATEPATIASSTELSRSDRRLK